MPNRVPFIQLDEWHRRQQDVYSDQHCALCGRPVAITAAKIRLSRTNDGEWWAIDYYREQPLEDEGHFGVFRLPIGPDCARRSRELAFAMSLPID